MKYNISAIDSLTVYPNNSLDPFTSFYRGHNEVQFFQMAAEQLAFNITLAIELHLDITR